MFSGTFESGHGVAKVGALVAIDPPGDATPFRIIRHQYQVTSCQADKRGESGTFRTALIFFHLDQELLPLLNNILNAHLRHWGRRRKVSEEGAADLLERQKPLALSAVIDERRLKACLYSSYPSLINISFTLGIARGLYIQIQQLLPIDDGNP